ncbi:MAG: XdhC family protein, partial [Nocardioides sp.]
TALADQLRALTRSGRATTEVTAERIVSVFVPVPTLVLVGGGPMIDAMEQLGGFLGWQVQRAFDPARATDLVVGLSPLDKLVVSGHDVEVAGPVLMAALRSRVGYIGALGGRPAQLALRDWLAVRGVDDDSAIYGPAGLDLGATSPQEVALSVLGQAIAVGTGRAGGPL